MIVDILLFIVGLIFLVGGSEYFVKSASTIAKKLRVSEFVIGLTLVALGTSIPELASSIVASLDKSPGIVVGNVVGSNVANIGLVIGIAATITVIKTKKDMLKRDGYFMLLASVLLLIFALNLSIDFFESIIFIILYVAYILYIFVNKSLRKEIKAIEDHPFNLHKLKNLAKKFLFYFKYNEKSIEKVDRYLLKHVGIFLLSGVAIVFGAKFLVEEAIFIAHSFGISDVLIGLTLIAVGTSLPELMVTISAARQGYANMAVGNVLGSNIANIFLILGVSGILFPIKIQPGTLVVSIPFMLILSILLLVFIKTEWKLKKWEGIILLLFYATFIIGSFYLF